MAVERVYYHVVLTVARGKPVFLNDEIDAVFKELVREIAQRGQWTLIELETIPNHVHVLVEKAPWQDLRQIVKAAQSVHGARTLRALRLAARGAGVNALLGPRASLRAS